MHSKTWLRRQLGRRERPAARTSGNRALRATGVLAAARLLHVDAPHQTKIPFSWQCPLQNRHRATRGGFSGAVGRREVDPNRAVPCAAREGLRSFSRSLRVSPSANPPGAPRPPRTPHTAWPQGQERAVPRPWRAKEASSVSTKIVSSIGCSLGLPKAKTRMETSHFFGQNSRQVFFFFLSFFFFFFSRLWLGTEIPCHENMTKPQTKTQLGKKPSPSSPGMPCRAGPRAGRCGGSAATGTSPPTNTLPPSCAFG